MTNVESKVIFLATGGTGGHIFPAKALANELKNRGYKPIIISDERFLKYTADNDVEYKILPVKQPKGGIKGKLVAGLSMIKSYFIVRKFIFEYNPVCAIGFGGYPSFPTLMAASQLHLKTIIHEQNSLLGKANELLLKNITKLATSFPNVRGTENISSEKVAYIGNPVRQEIKAVRDIPYPIFENSSVLNILVTGGSQGASIFSKLIPDAIAKLPEDYKRRIGIVQQARAETIDEVVSRYNEMGVKAEVKSFFYDMPEQLKNCHLLIARSGASTLAEAAVAGRPALMIPLPNSKGDHQKINAESFEQNGAGICFDERNLKAVNLTDTIAKFFERPYELLDMAKNARALGIADADIKLADLVESVIAPSA